MRYVVKTMDNGKYKKIRLSRVKVIDEHRLIMMKKLGRSLSVNEVVHHVNGDKSDNSFENLKVMSRDSHSKMHISEVRRNPDMRKSSRGENNKNAKLQVHTVVFSRVLSRYGVKPQEIADIFGVNRRTIRDAAHGVSWRHVKQLLPKYLKPGQVENCLFGLA